MRFSTSAESGQRLLVFTKLLRVAFRLLGPVAPVSAGALAEHMWLRSRRARRPPAAQAVFEGARMELLRVREHEVATYLWGEGHNVLLLHGWNGRAAQLGAFVEPLVESGCRVIGFDAPGHGRSSGTQSSLTEITRAMQTIGTAHGPFRAVVGHSFGGICTAVALQEGLAAERAVRVASPATLEWLTQQFAQRLRLPTPVVRQLNRRSAKRIGQNNWHRLYHDQQASSLEHPALILHDRDDDVVPWRQGKAFAQSWRHARFLLTEGLGHRRILRDPSVLQEVVRFVLVNPDPV